MAVHDDQWSNSPMVVDEELHLKQAEALLAIPDKICDRRSTVSGEFEFLGKKDFWRRIWEPDPGKSVGKWFWDFFSLFFLILFDDLFMLESLGMNFTKNPVSQDREVFSRRYEVKWLRCEEKTWVSKQILTSMGCWVAVKDGFLLDINNRTIKLLFILRESSKLSWKCMVLFEGFATLN